MNRQAAAILVMVLIIVALLVVATYASRFLLARAIRQVLALLRKHGATSPATAESPEGLGLVPKNPFALSFGFRDYKPYALRMLIQAGIVRETDNGGLYLSEEELKRSPLKRFPGFR